MSSDHPTALESANATSDQYLTFALAGGGFAIPILAVREIRGWEEVAQVPHSPHYILGVMNLRGTVVPVLDLRARLGMPPGERTATSVVIVVRVDMSDGSAHTIGCLVDAVSDVVSIADEHARPAPQACGTMDTHFLSAVATVNDHLVLILNLVHLVETSIGGRAAA
jgi:purine-binding chemotaxis protein CheW